MPAAPIGTPTLVVKTPSGIEHVLKDDLPPPPASLSPAEEDLARRIERAKMVGDPSNTQFSNEPMIGPTGSFVSRQLSDASRQSSRASSARTAEVRTRGLVELVWGQEKLRVLLAGALVVGRMLVTITTMAFVERMDVLRSIYLAGLVIDLLYLFWVWKAFRVWALLRKAALSQDAQGLHPTNSLSGVLTEAQCQRRIARRQRLQCVELQVPPLPDIETDQLSSRMRSCSHKDRVPNQILCRTMVGHSADMKAIRRIAERITDPDYSLRQYFNDCISCFPEIKLCFVGANTEVVVRTTSGVSDEWVYQRMMGAMFAVYWLMRLDKDGALGLTYGVNQDWKARKPSKKSVSRKHFVNMTDEERQTAFFQNMDWARLTELLNRAGCGRDRDGGSASVDRIVALLCLTMLHDIMKVEALQPTLQPEHAPYHGHQAGVRLRDHAALTYVLEYYPHLLPTYAALSKTQQELVFFHQGRLRFNYGWFVQAEAPPGPSLANFKAVTEEGAKQTDIDLYFVYWLAAMAGSSGTPLGGAQKLVLKMPHVVMSAFLWSMPFICRITAMSETDLMEQYLQARWAAITDEDVPTGPTAIAIMRLVLMAQDESPNQVMDAFDELSPVDQACLSVELSCTGVAGHAFNENKMSSGPAFLVYHMPALLQGAIGSSRTLRLALHIFCVVLHAARALWPLSASRQDESVIIKVTDLKDRNVDEILQGWSQFVWVLLYQNNQVGDVRLKKLGQLNELCSQGARFRLLDFSEKSEESVAEKLANNIEPTGPLMSGENCEVMMSRMSQYTLGFTASSLGKTSTMNRMPSSSVTNNFAAAKAPDPFKDSIRIMVFADMSTECDDECAFLWLVAALNRKPYLTTVELVMMDSHVRYQWMQHIFSDKFNSGEWQLAEDCNSVLVGKVLVKLYLAHSPEREARVIADIHAKAPNVHLDVKEVNGKMTAIRPEGTIGGLRYEAVPPGSIACIVVSAAMPDVSPAFFDNFTEVRCVYVVGTPGGVNCPQPSWADLLGALHRLAPVVYLTPQLTRTIRFPRNYVLTNPSWNENIRHTVWDATLTFMARRPEIPVKFGDWGLLLRLNAANAMFCRDWYSDVTGTSIDDAERPQSCIEATQSYVERNSGNDRNVGAVVDELRALGVDVSPEAFGLQPSDFVGGKPGTEAAKGAVQKVYRKWLFECVLICVMTTEKLLFSNPANQRIVVDAQGNERPEPICGYVDSKRSLAEIFGADDAINFLVGLPLRRLTPSYDVVAMLFADAILDSWTELDGGLGLILEEADSSMGLGLLSEEQRALSNHPILMTPAQSADSLYGAGPFG